MSRTDPLGLHPQRSCFVSEKRGVEQCSHASRIMEENPCQCTTTPQTLCGPVLELCLLSKTLRLKESNSLRDLPDCKEQKDRSFCYCPIVQRSPIYKTGSCFSSQTKNDWGMGWHMQSSDVHMQVWGYCNSMRTKCA
jgi:hypothetical protein